MRQLTWSPSVTSDLITTVSSQHVKPSDRLRKQLKSSKKLLCCYSMKSRGRCRPPLAHSHWSVDEGSEQRHAGSAAFKCSEDSTTKKCFEDQCKSSEPQPHFQMKMLLLLTWGRWNWKHWESNHPGPYTRSPSTQPPSLTNHKKTILTKEKTNLS